MELQKSYKLWNFRKRKSEEKIKWLCEDDIWQSNDCKSNNVLCWSRAWICCAQAVLLQLQLPKCCAILKRGKKCLHKRDSNLNSVLPNRRQRQASCCFSYSLSVGRSHFTLSLLLMLRRFGSSQSIVMYIIGGAE